MNLLQTHDKSCKYCSAPLVPLPLIIFILIFTAVVCINIMSLFISKLLEECNFQALGNDIHYSVFIHFTEIANRLKTMTSYSIDKETYRSYIKIFSFYHIFFFIIYLF